MFGNIGFGELMIIMMIVLLLFGAKRVPEVAKALAKSISEFKKGLNSVDSELREVLKSEPSKEGPLTSPAVDTTAKAH